MTPREEAVEELLRTGGNLHGKVGVDACRGSSCTACKTQVLCGKQ